MSLAPIHMRNLGLAAVGLTSIVSAHAQTTDPSLFTAFKPYCVDTSAIPEAVNKVVEAAGGVAKDSAFPGSRLTTWELGFGGETLEVASGQFPARTNEGDQDVCWVMGTSNDDVALFEAIRNWTGVASVAASPNLGGLIWSVFNYQEIAGMRTALPSDSVALDTTKSEGHVWRVTLMGSPRVAYVELRHFLPAVRR